MPNIIFYLNTGAKGKEEKFPLMAKIIFKRKRYYKTIASVKEPDWNPDKKRIYKSHINAIPNRSIEINATLNHLENLINKYNDHCLINELQVTEQAIKDILKGIDPIENNKSILKPDKGFNQAFEEWLEHSKQNNAYDTYRHRKSLYKFYVEFQENENFKITFKNIDLVLFDKLKNYGINKRKYVNNTFAKNIKTLKTFLGWCAERGYYSGAEHLKFKVAEKDITQITFTLDEFKTLYNFDFTSKKHQKVRDIFCFGCLTGLRYSDLQQLRHEHIQGDHIVKTMQKVKKSVQIPLVDLSRKIIERYKEQPVYILPRMSNQKFNDYLKEICELAGINASVNIDTNRGNQFTQETKPKYKVVTAHVARKTFITLSFYLGMNIKIVQEITGINQEKTLRKYLKIADEMKKTEMNKAWGKL
ncbi:MAG: tyrosine-type recombinase/integrase [Prolixibacteraceae bacterium]|jgi:integrase|nr:tyrosine-type recombinase/integrase [Prolixibacteraceae bacterium]MBT6005443.1 tyrosine-type recombinase/integrase [Prolixibacteraceae bacterium]MBT6765114.1 tyrosine-type recombinase/integrase [Prolixibacteraceae bacterium]MBT6999887.1 tyrosine-type recombinase/integrase [Prolixibacteraceae bacterium]MBT7396582.1 tyrosine-type recombinase/integrase [Prolixibacteraceae bacterium]